MTSPDRTPLELLLAWRRGDGGSGKRLFEILYPPLNRYFFNKVSDPNEGVQETLLVLFNLSEHQILKICDVKWYALGVARKILYAYLARRAKREKEALDFSEVCIAQLTPRTMSSLAHARREMQVFVDCLRELPVDDQILLELKYIEELSLPEIFKVLDIPPEKLNGRIQRTRQRFREVLRTRLERSGRAFVLDTEIIEAWAVEVRKILADRAPAHGADPRCSR